MKQPSALSGQIAVVSALSVAAATAYVLRRRRKEISSRSLVPPKSINEFEAEAKKRRVPLITRDWRQITKVVNDTFNVSPDVPKKLAKILGFGKKKKK